MSDVRDRLRRVAMNSFVVLAVLSVIGAAALFIALAPVSYTHLTLPTNREV